MYLFNNLNNFLLSQEGLSFTKEFKKLEDSYKIEFKKQKESYAGIDGMVHVELYEELKMAHEKKCQAGYEELRRKF